MSSEYSRGIHRFFTLGLNIFWGVSIIRIFKFRLNLNSTSGRARKNGHPLRWMRFFILSFCRHFKFGNTILGLKQPSVELSLTIFTLVIPSWSTSLLHPSEISPVSCKAPTTLLAIFASFTDGHLKYQASNFMHSSKPFFECSNMIGNTVSIAGESNFLFPRLIIQHHWIIVDNLMMEQTVTPSLIPNNISNGFTSLNFYGVQ